MQDMRDNYLAILGGRETPFIPSNVFFGKKET